MEVAARSSNPYVINVMAYGKAERFVASRMDYHEKFGIRYNGYAVLPRLSMLLEALCPLNFAVNFVCWPDLAQPWIASCIRQIHVDMLPHARPTLAHAINSLIASGHLGVNATVFLLGDVCFSTRYLSRILATTLNIRAESQEDPIFLGRFQPSRVCAKEASELFGFILPRYSEPVFTYEILSTVIKNSDRRYHSTARLWDMFNLQGEDSLVPVLESDDYTEDIDSADERRLFYHPLLEAAGQDDLARRILWGEPK